MSENPVLRVLDIVPGTSVDGPGLRTSIYFAGCAHRCPGCHNPESWDFSGGYPMTVGEILEEVEKNGFDVTFSGGDPMSQAEGLLPLAREIHRRGYSLWCYTGFMFEDIFLSPDKSQLLPFIDVIVDGPFIESKRSLSLLFRGSSNQRPIDVRRSSPGKIVLWEPDF